MSVINRSSGCCLCCRRPADVSDDSDSDSETTNHKDVLDNRTYSPPDTSNVYQEVQEVHIHVHVPD